MDSHWDYSHALQVAVSSYKMVPHPSIGFSPFYLMYGCEPLIPDKISFTTYLSDEDYEVTLISHIQDMIELNQSAL